MGAQSDIDYWRGPAFEEKDQAGETIAAFLSFINYSERTVPEWFEKKYKDAPSWLEKAEDAQRRIARLNISEQSP